MAKRSYSKKPMEWQFDAINTDSAVVQNGRIELGLRDDEVAEVHRVDSSISVGNIPDAANDDIDVSMMLSMDPDIIADPAVAINHEDLEVFFEHGQVMQQEVGAAGTAALNRGPVSKAVNFNPPILVGTDIGQVVHGDADVCVEFWTRVYFTRRRANVAELNQILLKRR